MNDKELKEHNVTEIEKMETAAGSGGCSDPLYARPEFPGDTD